MSAADIDQNSLVAVLLVVEEQCGILMMSWPRVAVMPVEPCCKARRSTFHALSARYKFSKFADLFVADLELKLDMEQRINQFKLQVRHDANKGRCLVAAEPIAAGQIVLEAACYAFVVDSGSLSVVCSGCHRPPVLVHGKPALPAARTPLPFSCADALAFAQAQQPTSPPHKPSNLPERPAAQPDLGLPQQCCGRLRYCSLACAVSDYERFHRFECDLFASPHSSDPASRDPKTAFSQTLWSLSEFYQDMIRLLLRVVTRSAWELHYASLSSSPQSKPSNEHNWTYPLTLSSDVWTMCDNLAVLPTPYLATYLPLAKLLSDFVSLHPMQVHLPTIPCTQRIELETRLSSLQTAETDNPASLTDLQMSALVLICKEECNSFGVYTFAYQGGQHERQSYGLGIYPDAVFFNHDCRPSVGHCTRSVPSSLTMTQIPPASVTTLHAGSIGGSKSTAIDRGRTGFGNPFQGPISNTASTMIFYAVRDLRQGEETVIGYLPLEGSVESRRNLLKSVFFFDCCCERCRLESEMTNVLGDDDCRCDLNDSVGHLCGVDGCCGWLVPGAVVARSDSAKDLMALEETTNQGALEWVCEGCQRVKRM